MEEFGITPAQDADMDMEIETSNGSLETTPETDNGLTSNAAQLGNISIETSLTPEQTKRVEITTQINKSRLDTLGTDPGNVTLYRFNESEDRWRAQETEVLSETAETVRVRAVADHASEWTAAAARPAFEITDWEVDVDAATVEETVNINVFVENTGGTEGTYVADLLLNGAVVDSKESVIAEGGEALFDFERAFDQVGTYEVEVNEQRITEVEVTEDQTVETDTEEDSSGTNDSTATDSEDETTSSDGSGPGFGVFAGLIAVVSIAVAMRRTQL
jgi:PGF-pre-PGF domain-containing protein